MKENLKVNILWLLLLLAGYGLISVLVSVGVLNLFYVQILQQIGINIILAVGLNLIVGFSGQFSLGHAGFMAIGAYAAAIIGSKSPTYGAFFGAIACRCFAFRSSCLTCRNSNLALERGLSCGSNSRCF